MKSKKSLPIVDDLVDVQGPAQTPSRVDALWFRARTLRHKLVRSVRDVVDGVHRAPRGERLAHQAASASSSLWTHEDPQERPLVAGKIHNLRLAAQRLDGAFLKAGEVWSFWAEVGPPWAMFGYVDGRELREGCLVPSVGGGLCQLSNAVYQCAVDAGCEILERHAHTAKLIGAASSTDRDATVFYPYVDLRFRLDVDLVISARLTRDRLVVSMSTREPTGDIDVLARNRGSLDAARSHSQKRAASSNPARRHILVEDHACDACGQNDCEVGEDARKRIHARTARTALLVDELSPELAQIAATYRVEGGARADLLHATDASSRRAGSFAGNPRATLAIPLPGALAGMSQYAWDTRGFDVVAAPLVALRRSRTMRALQSEGAARVRAQLRFDAELAAAYARFLGADVEHVVTAQSLLPHLWKRGDLGGRRYDVFLTRLPLFALHARLDDAARRFPESPLLRAYRAPIALVDAEREALAGAERLITPHQDIAASLESHGIARARIERVPWSPPSPSSQARVDREARRIVFPGPGAARKGAQAVRDAALALGLTVVLTGSDLEGEAFWRGVDVERTSWSSAFRRSVRAVVQPALVEDRPRRLLEALAMGVPVVATAACGVAGVVEVPFGDARALVAALDQRGQASLAGTQSGMPESIMHAL